MNDKEFIDEFKKIQFTKICKKVGVDRSNLTNGKASDESTSKVATELLKELEECINKYKGGDCK